MYFLPLLKLWMDKLQVLRKNAGKAGEMNVHWLGFSTPLLIHQQLLYNV